jgi:hypothetical protein
MHVLMLILGIALTAIGLFAVVTTVSNGISDSDSPLTVERLIMPIAMTAIGVGSVHIGIKPKSHVQPLDSRYDVHKS